MAKSKSSDRSYEDGRLADVGDLVHGKKVVGVKYQDHGDGVPRNFEYLTSEARIEDDGRQIHDTVFDYRHPEAGHNDHLVAEAKHVTKT